MKRIIPLFVLLWLALIVPSWAVVTDAPHNANSGITCSKCHSYSLWWMNSPASVVDSSSYASIVNAVCLKCHNDPNGEAPYKKAHSRASFEEAAHHGDWSTNCVDCHDPHFQAQLGWRDTESQNLYLVTGLIGDEISFIFHQDGTTTFDYEITGGSNAIWNAPSTWIDKNAASRSLIFVDNTLTADNTFVIIDADNTTITVQGVLPEFSAGNSFGLIYGQLVKSAINTPNSGELPVKFFDPNSKFALGGLTDPNIPVQGICQVCHTQTKYWRNNGNTDPETGEFHKETIVCTACHSVQSGFKPSGGPHTFLGESAVCVSCHQSGDILGLHHNDCQHCHSTPPALADPADKPLVVQVVRGNCQDCHGEMAHDSETVHNHRQVFAACAVCHMVETAYDVDIVHNDDCSTCHGYSGTELDSTVVANAIQTGMTGEDVNCRTCHAADHVEVTDTGGIHSIAGNCMLCHYVHGAIRAHSSLQSINPCLECHSGDFYSIWAEHNDDCMKCHVSSDSGVIAAIIEASRLGSETPANCISCHGTLEHDSSAIHDHRIVSGSCAACHVVETAAESDALHLACTTCHSSTKVEVVSEIAAGKGVSGKDVSCEDCHTTAMAAVHHSNANAAVGNCEYCHVDPRPSPSNWNAFAPGDNGSNSGLNVPTQLACKKCHVSFSGGNMIITKFTRTDYSKYTVDYEKTTQHTIPNSVGQINNYGICFGCHDGKSATAVTIWHARPDMHSPLWEMWVSGVEGDAARCTGSREVWDPIWPPPASLALYLPGRSSGTISQFNLFNENGFGYIPTQNDIDPCSDATDYQSTPLNFMRISIPPVAGNGNSSGSVPVFPSLTPMIP